ncbi:MAG TPA: exonuclease domain-containing protein [Bacteroidia bacterium]|jgi:DNA polymerase-3 subunit epsilon|nr:exonuclease domain-containing protein [Bacteroidia bacterium]
MLLNLTKPLAFFDLETTGITIGTDRIVEISILKLMPDGEKVIYTKRVNPEMPIPEASSKVHGIYDKDIANEPNFKQLASEINQFIGNADLAGYNSNKFDVPMLVDEFIRVGVNFEMKGRRMVDVQNIFHKMEQRTLAAAYKFYCEKEIVNAHSAEADIEATYEVFMAQLARYDSLAKDVEGLSTFSAMNKNVDLAGRIVFNEKNEEVFNFGKHKGRTVSDVFGKEPSYYDWMMQGDFPAETKQVLTALRLRGFNSK